MDISILLALDTAAFQQGLKAATDAVGQFQAAVAAAMGRAGDAAQQAGGGVQDAATAAQRLGEAAQTAGGGVQDAATAAQQLGEAAQTAGGGVQDAATAAQKLGEAAQTAGGGVQDAATAAQRLGDAAKTSTAGANELTTAVKQSQGAMAVASGAASALSGDFRGVAAGTMQAAGGMRAFGVSIKAVERASVVLAAIGAVIATVRTAIDALKERAESLDAIRLEGLERGAEKARDRFDALARAMERAAGLRKDLDDVAGSERRLEQERKLAELERDRNAALASGGDADEINKRFDAKKRELEFSFQREEAGAKVSGIQSEREDIAKQIALLEKRRQSATDTAARYDAEAKAEYAKGDAGFGERVFLRGDLFNRSNDEHNAKGDEFSNKAVEALKEAGRIGEEIARLKNRDTALAGSEKVAQGQAAVIDIKEQAANAAANLPPPPKKDESGGGVKDPATRGGGWGSMQTASDRLARIGGFVGGSYSRQNEAREQIQLDREKLAVLKNIDENTKNKESGGLA